MRNMKNHRNKRAFLFKRDDRDNLVMWYKSSPLDPVWKGYTEEDGLQILDGVPEGKSEILLPKEIPDDLINEVLGKKFTAKMKNSDIEWWERLKEDQDFLQPKEETYGEYELFWELEEIEENANVENGEVQDVADEEPIVVADHPTTIGEIEIGDLIAVHGEESDFWIGEVINVVERTIHIQYYKENKKTHQWMKMKDREEGSIGTICFIIINVLYRV